MIANDTARDLIDSVENLLRADNLKGREAEKVRELARTRVKEARAEIHLSHLDVLVGAGGGK